MLYFTKIYLALLCLNFHLLFYLHITSKDMIELSTKSTRLLSTVGSLTALHARVTWGVCTQQAVDSRRLLLITMLTPRHNIWIKNTEFYEIFRRNLTRPDVYLAPITRVRQRSSAACFHPTRRFVNNFPSPPPLLLHILAAVNFVKLQPQTTGPKSQDIKAS